jgi:hypothetical protein
MSFWKLVLIILTGAAILCAGLWFRATVLDSAAAHLGTLNLNSADIVGTRIPCSTVTDVGVYLMYFENGMRKPARLCREIWSSEWVLIPISYTK